jgi:uncharacterized membrane protein YfcA
VNWLWFALAGGIAQLVDGSLGMGFGLTSATLLVTLGTSAAVASAAVHAAEIGTTLVSGISHWHRENIDPYILRRIAIPGGIGAFAGATFLSNIDLSNAKVFVSTLLLLLGFALLYRQIFKSESQVPMTEIANPTYLRFLGAIGGFIDASGGGGWGPVVTPTLMATTATEPRKIVGTVSAAEFIVALCASAGFLANLQKLDINWGVVGGLALGGALMAPIAARFVSKTSHRRLGIFIAVAIILLNGSRLIGF